VIQACAWQPSAIGELVDLDSGEGFFAHNYQWRYAIKDDGGRSENGYEAGTDRKTAFAPRRLSLCASSERLAGNT
jgi:hypothetical protein